MSVTVKKLANSFGLKVSEFATLSGYSRQGLYDLIERNKNANTSRFNAFISHIELVGEEIYQQDLTQAKIEKNERMRLINQLREMRQI